MRAPPATWTWPRGHVALVACGVVGLAISLYLSVVHLTAAVPLYCSNSGLVNCEQVITSPSAYVLGIPVAYFGVLWFVGLLALLLAPQDAGSVRAVRLVWVCSGVAFALLLIYNELFVIGSICLWCTAVHALVFVIFIVTMLAPTVTAERDGTVGS